MKKVRPEVKIKGSGGLTDVFDNMLKVAFNITDEEYDYIVENATDDELTKFVAAFGSMKRESTFSERRAALEIRNKYLNIK